MPTSRNKSILKAFEILKAFRGDQWVGALEIVRRTGFPEPSVYRMLLTLREIGAVEKGPRGSYRPGLLLQSLLGNIASDKMPYVGGRSESFETGAVVQSPDPSPLRRVSTARSIDKSASRSRI